MGWSGRTPLGDRDETRGGRSRAPPRPRLTSGTRTRPPYLNRNSAIRVVTHVVGAVRILLARRARQRRMFHRAFIWTSFCPGHRERRFAAEEGKEGMTLFLRSMCAASGWASVGSPLALVDRDRGTGGLIDDGVGGVTHGPHDAVHPEIDTGEIGRPDEDARLGVPAGVRRHHGHVELPHLAGAQVSSSGVVDGRT